MIPDDFEHRHCDRHIVTEVFTQHAYKVLAADLDQGELVLDLGAHIGCTSRYLLDRGAHVVAVEMLRENIRLLRHNTRGYKEKITIIEGAVSEQEGEVTALMAKGNGNPMGAYVNGTKRDVADLSRYHHWQVPVVTLKQLLAMYRPSRLKFDIESSEYTVIKPQLLADAGVKVIVGEYHVQSPETWDKAQELYAGFGEAGYEMNRPAPPRVNGWGVVVVHRLAQAAVQVP
jgi:FkbM family methyltransferase